MTFEIKDVFTALNAEEVMPGARGYFADTKAGLIRNIKAGWDQTLDHVEPDTLAPFCVEGTYYCYAFFLPLEQVKGSAYE